MSVQLDWQQDLEDEGWPMRQDYGPPPRRLPRWARWLLLALLAVVAGAAVSIWQLNDRGLRIAKADVQQSLDFAHQAIQTGDRELFRSSIDAANPTWQSAVLNDWDVLVMAARGAPAPVVESIKLPYVDLAATTVRWVDGTSGQSYLAKRWFRLVEGKWLWSQPRKDNDDEQTETLSHLTLSYQDGDLELAPAIAASLDQAIAGRCQTYGVSEERCHFFVRWALLSDQDQPLLWSDLALPALGRATPDSEDDPVYLVNATDDDWHSTRLRRRLLRFFPGQGTIARARLDVLRPGGLSRLPEDVIGEQTHPLLLPSPWLTGIDDNGAPHPQWQAFADRILADAVMRRAEGPIVGSARYVNGAWALHQAILAANHGLSEATQQQAAAAASLLTAAPLEFPTLSSLGEALQTQPSELASSQLASLAQFLDDNWSAEQLAALAAGLGETGSLDRLLPEYLNVDLAAFEEDWRAEQLQQPESPLAELSADLKARIEDEAKASSGEDPQAVLQFYSATGRVWRADRRSPPSPFGKIEYGPDWDVTIKQIGAVEDVVWVELEEQDGQNRMADLRFYRKDGTQGWLREAPVEAFWGQRINQRSERARWRYYEADEPVVQAIMPTIDGYVEQIQADLGLPTGEVSISVEATTASNWRLDEDPMVVRVASPRNYLLDTVGDPRQEALRRELAAMLIIQQTSAKANTLPRVRLEGQGSSGWIVLVAAMRYELDRLDIPTPDFFEELTAPIAAAVEDERLPGLRQVLAEDRTDRVSVETSGKLYLVTYILERHSTAWLDALVIDGFQPSLEKLMAEKGWSWEDLEADWHSYLDEKFG